MHKTQSGSRSRLPSLNVELAKHSSGDKGKATPRKQALPPADDVFQDVTPDGKFRVKGFKSKLAQQTNDDPYASMVLANGMYIYPWDPEGIRNFLESEDDHEEDQPGAHPYVYIF